MHGPPAYEIIYNAATAGIGGRVASEWWLFIPLSIFCFYASFAVWRARRTGTYWQEKRFERIRGMRYPITITMAFGIACDGCYLQARYKASEDKRRLIQHSYQEWTGTLTSDVIQNLGGRRPTLEKDQITVEGMLFTVECFEPLGWHRIGSPGACPPFQLGTRLTVLYVPLPNDRYRLAALQVWRWRFEK